MRAISLDPLHGTLQNYPCILFKQITQHIKKVIGLKLYMNDLFNHLIMSWRKIALKWFETKLFSHVYNLNKLYCHIKISYTTKSAFELFYQSPSSLVRKISSQLISRIFFFFWKINWQYKKKGIVHIFGTMRHIFDIYLLYTYDNNILYNIESYSKSMV